MNRATRFFSRLFSKTVHVYPGGIFHFTRAARDLSQFAQWRGHVLVSSGGWALTASWIAGHQSSAGYRAAFPPIPTRSNASLLSLSFPENDSRAGSIHAVRPTPPRGS